LERRSFLAWAGRLAAGVAGFIAGGCRGRERARAGTQDDGSVRAPPASPRAAPVAPAPSLPALPDDEVQTLEAMLARLLPADPATGAPGALAAGVPLFVVRALAAPHFASLLRTVRLGLKYLDAVTRKQWNQRFHEIEPGAQDEVLARFQQGSVDRLHFPTAQFFTLVHTLALEGYLGDPRHGGNRDKAAWRWLGVDPTCGRSMNGECR
jgi:gluconate 2-dehydrogenase gamma chain